MLVAHLPNKSALRAAAPGLEDKCSNNNCCLLLWCSTGLFTLTLGCAVPWDWKHTTGWKQFIWTPIFFNDFFPLVNERSKTFLVFLQQANLLLTETSHRNAPCYETQAESFTAWYCCTANKVRRHESLCPTPETLFHDTVRNKNMEISPRVFEHQTGCSNFCLKDKTRCPHAQMWYLSKSGSQYTSCCAKTNSFIANLTPFDSFSEHLLVVCFWGFQGGFSYLFSQFPLKDKRGRTKVKGSI